MKRILPLLAAILFSAATVGATWAQDSYRLRPGDTVSIEVLEDETLNREALVRPDGFISVPFAGSVQAGGRTVTQVQAEVAGLLAPNFASPPNVFVTLSARPAPMAPFPPRTFPVYVIGEVTTPGLVEARSGTTLLQALSQSGGFSRFAATKRVMLRRTDSRTGREQVYVFNYDAIISGAAVGGSTRLVPGDVIVVPQRKLFE